jgi:thiol-disulfide isomerase/thioredoxin
MKKSSLFMTVILALLMSLILINGCKVDNNKNDYLRKVLHNLDKIKSASYFSTASTSFPGDTLNVMTISVFTEEYFNPTDTVLGSSFAESQQMNSIKIEMFYDGKASTFLDWNKKSVEIDSFPTKLKAPFFNHAKSIIKYAFETKDSISTELKDFGDSVLFQLVIHADKQVEFYGKPVYNYNPYGPAEEISRYDIWINKSNDLPYRIRRSMLNNTSCQTCKNVEFNNNDLKDFIVSKRIPPNFTIKSKGKEKPIKSDLVGKVAPSWVLNDFNNKPINLEELKSKVIMIQFTGIGCGPCHAAIPFLRQFVSDYKGKDFEFVSIETWSKNIEGMKEYHKNNDMNYRFLLSTEETAKNYEVTSVPIFFILDKDRIIRKIIRGYGEGTTEKEIRDAINGLI